MVSIGTGSFGLPTVAAGYSTYMRVVFFVRITEHPVKDALAFGFVVLYI